ncbi:MAG: hypothetical protein KAY65_13425, partial [Planctomycetes bacterium]|nr:hypothetical protein [Planctomycetota bacterium]
SYSVPEKLATPQADLMVAIGSESRYDMWGRLWPGRFDLQGPLRSCCADVALNLRGRCVLSFCRWFF